MRKKFLIIAPILLFLIGTTSLIAYRLIFLKMVRVPTSAMANTIVPGDCLVVKRLSGDPIRGDIIIFSYPNNPSIQYASRVVGLPGETIQVRDTSVYISDKPIPEQRVFVKYPLDFEFGALDELSTEGSGPYRVFYFKPDSNSSVTMDRNQWEFAAREPLQIPSSQYFVMGDNRDNSLDSRHWGTVPRDLIWGKPTMIYWSSHEDQSHQETVKWERIGKGVK